MKKIFFALLFGVCAISTIFSTQSAFAKDDSCDGLKFDTLSVAGTCLNVENIEEIEGAGEGEVCWCHIESISPKPGGYSEWFGYSTLEGCGEFCDTWCAEQISNEDSAYQDWLETLSECEEPEPEPKCISVEFDSNGMSGGLENQYYYKWDTGPDVSNIYVDSACEEEVDGVSAPTSSGNIFTGYFNNSTNGSGTQYINSSMGTTSAWNNITTSGTTLYAQYTDAPCITITLDANGGDLNPWNNLATKKLYKKGTLWYSDTKDKCKKDENLITTLSPIPGKIGGFFDGLYENSDGTGEQYIDENGNLSDTWIPTSDTTIYAKYAGCILITLNDNCGTNPGTAQVWKIEGRPGWYSNSTCTTQKTTQSAPTCAIAGTFGGYYTTRASSGGTRYITSASTNNLDSSWAPTSSATLYARWTSCATGYHTNNTGGCDVNTYNILYSPAAGTTGITYGEYHPTTTLGYIAGNNNASDPITYDKEIYISPITSWSDYGQGRFTGWVVTGIVGNNAEYRPNGTGSWIQISDGGSIEYPENNAPSYYQFRNLTTTNGGTVTFNATFAGSCSLGSYKPDDNSSLLTTYYDRPVRCGGNGQPSCFCGGNGQPSCYNVYGNIWSATVSLDRTVYGESKRTNNSTTSCARGTPSSTSGNHCWCHVLGFSDGDSYTSIDDLPWVYLGANYGSNTSCSGECATVLMSNHEPGDGGSAICDSSTAFRQNLYNYANAICLPNRYKIQYDLDGGKNGTYAPGYGIYGENVRVSPPTKYGNTFTGWTIQNSSGDPRYGCNPSYDINTQIGNSTVNCSSGGISGDIYFKNLRNDNYDPDDQNAPVVTLFANWSGNNACPTNGQHLVSLFPNNASAENVVLNTHEDAYHNIIVDSMSASYGQVVLEGKLSVIKTTNVPDTGNPLTPINNEIAPYCWCRVASYTPTGLPTITTPDSPWVYIGESEYYINTNNLTPTTLCQQQCYSAASAAGAGNLRGYLYGSVEECKKNLYSIEYHNVEDISDNTGCATDAVVPIKPLTAYYDEYFSVSTPTRQGCVFTGWTISYLQGTPQSGNSSTSLSNMTVSNGTATNVTDVYFKNLRNDHNSATHVVFTANWEPINITSSCSNGYHAARSGLPQAGTGDAKLAITTNSISINHDGITESNCNNNIAADNYCGKFTGVFTPSNSNAYGTIHGIGICSSTAREPNPKISDGGAIYEQFQIGAPANDGGQYCWCHLNTYVPATYTNGNIMPENSRTLVYAPWVFLEKNPTNNCTNYGCAEYCSEQSMDATRSDISMRTTLYQDTYYCVINTYNITYVANGGVLGNGPTSAQYDVGFTVPDPTTAPANAIFNGWEISGLDTGTHYWGHQNSGSNTVTDSSYWVGNTSTTTSGGINWFKNLRNDNGGTVTFTAQWLCNDGYHESNGSCVANTYNISYTLNGGTNVANPVTSATYGTPVNISHPSHAYATFANWTVSNLMSSTISTPQSGTANNSLSNMTVSNGTATGVTDTWFNNLRYDNVGDQGAQAVMFTANWTCNTGYTLSNNVCQPDPHTIALNQNGGVAPSGQTLTSTLYTTYNTNVYIDSARTNAMTTASNSCSNPVTPPTKTGYTFAGYYSASSGGTQYIDSNGCITSNGNSAGINYTSDETWYAQYTPNCNMITFNNTANGGSANTYRYRKTGVTNKWYSDSNCTNETTTIGAPTKANATFAGYYVEQNTRTTQVGTTASPILPSSWATTTTATVYAHYSCSANYRQSGEYISGACTTWEQTITLSKNNGSGGTSALYTRYGVGVYINSARNPGHMMSEDDSQNQGGGITIGEGLNAPNPVTPPTKTGYTFAGYYSASQSNNNQTNGTQYIDANGYITSDGISAGTALQADGTWYAQYIPQCNEIVIDNETNGGSTQNGTLYKKTGDAAWYSDSNCTTATTTVTKPEKDHATFLAYYVSDDVNAPGNTVSNGVPTFNTGASAFIVTSSMLEELEPGNYITVYAHYNCVDGYQYKGINIQNACEPDQRTITLDDETNGGDAGSGAIYTIYDTGVYTDSSRQDQMTTSDYPVTIPTKVDAVFTGYYDSDSGTKKYIDEKGYITDSSSGDDGISAGIAYTSDETWYAQFEDCACTFGAHVASCVLSSVEDNQCVFEYTCDSGYNTDGAHNAYTSNGFTGDAGVGANTSPDCYENIITLNWYKKVDYDNVNDNRVTQLSVPQASQSCTYGDAITIPDSTTVPALYIKGKHLTGWTVVQ